MRIRSGLGALIVLAAVLTGAMPGGAAAGEALTGDSLPAIRPMTDGEAQAAGCVVSSVAAMGATYAIGPSEFIMLVVGGLIVPSSTPVLLVSLLSTMASMACSAGALITPGVLWAWKQAADQPGEQTAVSGRTGDAVAVLDDGRAPAR
jgi:hypothetical protein